MIPDSLVTRMIVVKHFLDQLRINAQRRPVSPHRVRIAHLSDAHIEIPPEKVRPGSWVRLLRDRDAVNALDVDLVAVTGDLTTFGSADVSHLELAREWLEGFSARVLAVPGNHDLGPSPGRAALNPYMEAFETAPFEATRYGRTMGVEALQSLDLGCVRVYGISVREGDPDGVLDALETRISADSRPVVVCGHYPVVNPRPGYAAPEFGTSDFAPQTAERLKSIIVNASNPVIYLCGHVHLNSMTTLSTRHHQFSAGGLGPGSSTFRVFDIHEHRLSYTTHLGSGPPLTWAYPDGVHSPEFSLGQDVERAGQISWTRDHDAF